MSFRLDAVVPWGRRLDEYRTMFALSEDDLAGTILGCGDGPASFNAEATARGHRVVSFDPLYQHDADEIRARVEAVFDDLIARTATNADEFVWGRAVDDIDDLATKRRTAAELFLADYPGGRAEGRYVPEELPVLPFADGSFDLALCSHLLFLYGEQLSASFHVDALVELCRVAHEVRVFPLLELGSVPSRHLAVVREQLTARGIGSTVETVGYEFQRGGDEQLVLRRA
jgi:hypothetical protein